MMWLIGLVLFNVGVAVGAWWASTRRRPVVWRIELTPGRRDDLEAAQEAVDRALTRSRN